MLRSEVIYVLWTVDQCFPPMQATKNSYCTFLKNKQVFMTSRVIRSPLDIRIWMAQWNGHVVKVK